MLTEGQFRVSSQPNVYYIGCGRKLEYPLTLTESSNSTYKALKPGIKSITIFFPHFTSVQFLHF